MTAVILAGGFGTRIQHLLHGLPKPMAPVHGRPFVEWVVRYLYREGIDRVILSTGYKAETVQEHFNRHPVHGVDVCCVPELNPLGTAGGFLNAVLGSGMRSAAWLVLNGDSLVLASLAPLIASLDNPRIEGGLLAVSVPDASRFGTIQYDALGRMTAMKEKTPGAGDINAGVYLFRDAALSTFPEKAPLSFELDVFPALLKRGANLQVVRTDAPFIDIGTPESLPLAEEFITHNRTRFAG